MFEFSYNLIKDWKYLDTKLKVVGPLAVLFFSALNLTIFVVKWSLWLFFICWMAFCAFIVFICKFSSSKNY